MTDHPHNATAAARLLHSGQQIGARVVVSFDLRTQALVQAGLAAGTFLYIWAALLIAAGQSTDAAGNDGAPSENGFITNLLLPFFALTSLTLASRERLRATLPSRFPSLWILVGIACWVPFLIALFATIFGASVGWWVFPLIALCAAAPPLALAMSSALKARASSIHPMPDGPREALSGWVIAVTLAMGMLFGLAAATSTFPWGRTAGFILLGILLTYFLFQKARWGIIHVGAEWGSAQWVGFASSFGLLVLVTVVLACTPLGSPLGEVVGIVGGVAVAAPLVFSAFRGSVIRERPEEFWDAPTV
ncbi:hypothetical protein [Glaciibacter psychrotolerans]|nr:hypothetical protein [Leifsonia psychrotolerans]